MEQASSIHVVAADAAPQSINNCGFGVKDLFVPFVYFNSVVQEPLVERATGKAHRMYVGLSRQEELNLNSSSRSANQSATNFAIRNAIGVANANALLSAANRLEITFTNGRSITSATF